MHLIFLIFQSELFEALENSDFQSFASNVQIGREIGIDFDDIYGQESGYKTILQLAIEEDDGLPYVQELVKVNVVLLSCFLPHPSRPP